MEVGRDAMEVAKDIVALVHPLDPSFRPGVNKHHPAPMKTCKLSGHYYNEDQYQIACLLM